MYDVRIPDYLYQQAVQAAEARHESIDQFVAEAVQLHLQQEVAALTDDQIAAVRKGQEDAKAGRVYSPEQIREHFQAKHDAWENAQS